MADEQLRFRASLEDDASKGLREIQRRAATMAGGVDRSGQKAAKGFAPITRNVKQTSRATREFRKDGTDALRRFTRATQNAAKVTHTSTQRIVRDLDRVPRAARSATSGMALAAGGGIGGRGAAGLGASAALAGGRWGGRLKGAAGSLGLVGGLAAVGMGLRKTFTLGLDFTRQMNTLGAVTQATGAEMAQATERAKDLGNAMDIPATSASDAAQAMVELSKGGLSVADSMKAARGTLMLAAAAQTSAGEAAEIQANALNAFGLSADKASFVADVLANTANAASGEIGDFASSLSFVGPVANQFGITIDQTAAMLGIFANNGLKGSMAGTTLRSMLLHLAAPSAQAQKALDQLGITVYDSQHHFVGLKSLTGQLAKAQANMSDEAFQSASAMAFGIRAVQGAQVAAKAGADAYQDMDDKVTRAGGAVDLANAKLKGMPGAIEHVVNAIQDVALSFYQRLAPSLTSVLDGFTDLVNVAGPIVITLFGTLLDVVGGAVHLFEALPGPVRAFGYALAGVALAKKIGLVRRLAGAFGGVSRAMRTTSAEGGMLRGTFRRLRGGARSMGRSLLGAVGGPGGLAVTGAITAIVAAYKTWQDEVHLTDDILNAHKGIVEGLAEAERNYAESGDKAQRRANAFDTIHEQFPDLLGMATGHGVSPDKLVDAYLGLPSGQNVADRIRKWQSDADEAAGSVTSRSVSGIWGWAQLLTGNTASGLITNANKDAQDAEAKRAASLNSFLNSAEDAAKLNKQRQEAIGVTNDELGRMGDTGQEALNKTEDAARGALSAMSELGQQRLADWMIGLDNPVVNMWAEIVDTSKGAVQQAQAYIRALDQINGKNVEMADAKQRVNDANRALTGVFKTATKDTHGRIESLIRGDGSINTVTEAGSQLRTGLQSWRQDAYTLVTATVNKALGEGLSNAKAAKLGQKALDKVKAGFEHAAAASKVDPAAVASIEKALGLDNLVSGVLDKANVAQFEQAIGQAAKSAGDDVQKQLTAGVNAVVDLMEQHDTVKLPAGLDTSAAHVTYEQFKRLVSQTIMGRMNLQVQAHLAATGGPSSVGLSGQSYAAATAKAHGGLVQAAANGLLRDPMIAKGGSNILWAEPETGWEAYIPGALDKRARSEQLMVDVAARFGGQYTPAAQVARPMADGGVPGAHAVAVRAPAARGDVNIGDINIYAGGTDDPQQLAETFRDQLVAVLGNDRERAL